MKTNRYLCYKFVNLYKPALENLTSTWATLHENLPLFMLLVCKSKYAFTQRANVYLSYALWQPTVIYVISLYKLGAWYSFDSASS